MKKLLTILLAGALAICACFSLIGCGKDELKFGKELLKCDSQLDTLVQLDNGSADVAIIDSVMAGYYTATGEYKDKVVKLPYSFAEEQYGIAGRKDDKAFMSEINKALIALFGNGKMYEIANTFGLASEIAITPETTDTYANATDNSWDKIKESKKIVIGYTVFAPIAFTENDVFTGYDIELAKAVVEYLKTMYSISELKVEFKEIDWDSKETLLNNGTIDLIWNGLTITEERATNMCLSFAYLNNKQVGVVRKDDYKKFYLEDGNMTTVLESFNSAIIAVESGSAGEEVVVKAK